MQSAPLSSDVQWAIAPDISHRNEEPEGVVRAAKEQNPAKLPEPLRESNASLAANEDRLRRMTPPVKAKRSNCRGSLTEILLKAGSRLRSGVSREVRPPYERNP
jgi:hypothetical protein